MLEIVVPGSQEMWDELHQEFVYGDGKDVTLRLEHSLISISKWEAKWQIPFISSDKNEEQIMDYIKCMTLNPPADPEVYNRLTLENVRKINEYIESPMTATTIHERQGGRKNNEIVTSELIYYWMITFGIPVEFEKWHINRLIMLIRVCAAKNEPSKKMSRSEIMAQNRALNAARRARLHSKG